MNLRKLVLLAAALVSAAALQAFPIATSGDGLKVFAGSTNHIIATYEGNSASYSNDLYLEGFGFIFNNHVTPVGTQVDLGSFITGTELVFRLYVNNTQTSYYTGPADRNPDDHSHARAQSDWMPNTTLVSFEDLYNGPFDFNDLSFSFTNTVGSDTPPTNGVPDGLSTGGALLVGFLALARMARNRRV